MVELAGVEMVPKDDDDAAPLPPPLPFSASSSEASSMQRWYFPLRSPSSACERFTEKEKEGCSIASVQSPTHYKPTKPP